METTIAWLLTTAFRIAFVTVVKSFLDNPEDRTSATTVTLSSEEGEGEREETEEVSMEKTAQQPALTCSEASSTVFSMSWEVKRGKKVKTNFPTFKLYQRV